MIVGHGIDITEIYRIRKNINNERFLKKIYTDKEREYLESRKYNSETAAGMFAAKEAVSKCLGTGFLKFGPSDIEIVKDNYGKPSVVVLNNALLRAREISINNFYLSISHTKEYAVASCVAEKND